MPVWDIATPPSQEWELRVVIWRTQDVPVPASNKLRGMSDLFVSVRFDRSTQRTDTHWCCLDGRGHFNWRCVYRKIAVRKGFPVDGELSLSLDSARVFGNDFQVAELILDLKPYLVNVAATASFRMPEILATTAILLWFSPRCCCRKVDGIAFVFLSLSHLSFGRRRREEEDPLFL